MANTPSWGKRPTSKTAEARASSIDQFVNGEGKTERINVLVTPELRRRVKTACASEGVTISAVITEFLEQRFPKK